MSAPVPRRPMTEAERALVRALARCSFPVASSPKRFARELASQLAASGDITEAQAAYLRRLVATYRRQIPASSVPEAERYLLTDAAARAVREGDRATRWTAEPGRPVPSWVVRLTGKSTVEAIVAKWGEGATFERPTLLRVRATVVSAPPPDDPPQPSGPPPAAAPQLQLFDPAARSA